MPFGLNTLRNDRELFVLKKIERFQVNEYMGRSNWARYYFDSYKDAIKKFRDLRQVKSKVMIFACRKGDVEEMTTGILDRKFFSRYKYRGSYV
jgi:hypothetical protein